MPDQNASRTPVSDALPRAPRAWSAPEIRDLPALVDLTLRSPIGGNFSGELGNNSQINSSDRKRVV